MATAFSGGGASEATGAEEPSDEFANVPLTSPVLSQVGDHIRLAKLQNTSTDDKSRDSLLHSFITASHVHRYSARRTLVRAYGCKHRDHPIQCDKLRDPARSVIAKPSLLRRSHPGWPPAW